MSLDIFITIATLLVAALGLIFKSLKDMQDCIKTEVEHHVTMREKLNLLNYRLDNLETQYKIMEAKLSDIIGYLASNSDYHNRKHDK